MRVAVIGSRNIQTANIEKYLPANCSEIVSGGAKGVDQCARDFAINKNIKLTEFLPDYKRYNRGAPIIRNKQIVDYADFVIAFWDEKSKGTLSVINYCKQTNTPCKIILLNNE